MEFKLKVSVTTILYLDTDDFKSLPNQIAVDYQDVGNSDEEQADSLLHTIMDFGQDTHFEVEVAD